MTQRSNSTLRRLSYAGDIAQWALGRRRAEPLIAFVHIPKTAGGTLRSMFFAAYPGMGVRDAGNYISDPQAVVRNLSGSPWWKWRPWIQYGGRVIVGHMPYGLFKAHLPADTRYITFLREPVERVLSHYDRHIRRRRAAPRRAAHRRPRAGKVKADSLEEALIVRRLPQLNNLATRLLSDMESPLGELPACALDQAKANLRTFALVGIQERFVEAVALLQRRFDLDAVPSESQHVNATRPTADEIPAGLRALILEHNQLDADLYAWALRLFDEAVASAGQGFAADVERLRARLRPDIAVVSRSVTFQHEAGADGRMHGG